MDFRIVNTCNNDCLFCLERGLRNRKPFLGMSEILEMILKSEDDRIWIYWGNPLLHPDFKQIVNELWKTWKNISVMTNTFWLDNYNLVELKMYGLSGISVFFNSFDENIHNKLTWWSLPLKKLLKNIDELKSFGLLIKFMINVNSYNIDSIYKDVLLLNKLFWINIFEFSLVFPFDKPWENKEMFFDFNEKREKILKLFKVIKSKKIEAYFYKFPKEFFAWFSEFYDEKRWVEDQIWEEDIETFKEKNPICLQEKRCVFCYLREVCPHYQK